MSHWLMHGITYITCEKARCNNHSSYLIPHSLSIKWLITTSLATITIPLQPTVYGLTSFGGESHLYHLEFLTLVLALFHHHHLSCYYLPQSLQVHILITYFQVYILLMCLILSYATFHTPAHTSSTPSLPSTTENTWVPKGCQVLSTSLLHSCIHSCSITSPLTKRTL